MSVVPDEIPDEYAAKARVLWASLRDTQFHDGRNKIAALLRAEVARLTRERDDMRLDRDAQVEALSESLEEANARAGAKDEALKAALHKDQSCPCYLCVLIRAAIADRTE